MMTPHKGKFIFGPVFSRRLGRSLGVDTVPFKTCTYDCVYCQLGRTDSPSAEICPYAEPSAVISELRRALPGARADYITLSGSGEPTLNSGIGELMREIKKITSVPVCLLTNGSLLSRSEVRERVKEADVIIPSLDASCEETFKLINRPHPSITFSGVAEGIKKLRETFAGKLYLEIMFVEGLNDSEKEIRGFIPLIERINPDLVQINTVIRPPAYDSAGEVAPEKLLFIKRTFGEKAVIIAVSEPYGGGAQPPETLLEIISRRPVSASEAQMHTGIPMSAVLKLLSAMERDGLIERKPSGGEMYYASKRKKRGKEAVS